MYIEYICIDACHLRGPFGGVLMCATTLDPNKNMLVLAQAILPTENLEHWDYFLYHLNACGMGNNINNQAATHTSKPTTITDLHDLETIPIAPPKREVRRGRKPTRRIESQSKSKRKAADTILCPFCNQPGHNRRTCPSLRDASTI
jgi:hypothetical protein